MKINLIHINVKKNSRNDSSSRELRKMPLRRALGIDARERFTDK
jgi:hypothetical protein